jgi:pimeloyl-ACP methyl ester carboxylesterase
MDQAPQLRIIHREPLTDGVGPRRRAVFVHGAMDRATSFTRLMARLPAWSILAYDRRGYAGSARAGPPESFEDQVADLLAVLDGQPAVAFGHSLGGDVVLATAARRPDLIPAALIWEPPQPWLEWWPSHSLSGGAAEELEPEDRAEWFMRRMIGDRVWERLPSATRAKRRAEGRTLHAELLSLGEGAPFDPAQVRIPVLVGRGGEARPHHRRGGRELAAALPKGRMVEIAGAQHGAHLTHPAELAALFEEAAALAASG